MTKNQPFFTHHRDSDTFMPTPVSSGPWDLNSLHGRVVVGLLAHVIEQRHGSDDFVPARLTVDMFRLPNTTTPIEVRTKLVRDGMRIKVVEAEFFSGGTSMALTSLSRYSCGPPTSVETSAVPLAMHSSANSDGASDVRSSRNVTDSPVSTGRPRCHSVVMNCSAETGSTCVSSS